jgi:WD40 repeat protein
VAAADAGDDGAANLYDTTTWEVVSSLAGHVGAVYALCWLGAGAGGGGGGGACSPEGSTGRVALTPGGCQIGYTCDQNSTYGLHSLPGGVRLVTRTILAVIN